MTPKPVDPKTCDRARRRAALVGALGGVTAYLALRACAARGDAGPLFAVCRVHPALGAGVALVDDRAGVAPGPDLSGRGHGVCRRPGTPEAVVFAGPVRDFNHWRKESAAELARLKSRLVHAGADGDHRLFDVVPGERQPILVASAFYADKDDERATAFTKAYRAAFGVDPDVHAANANDAKKMLVEAMKQAGPFPAPERVREKLLQIKDFQGVAGALTITGERTVQRRAFVLAWENGEVRLHKPAE